MIIKEPTPKQSSYIAKSRLLSLQAQARSEFTGATSGYIQNEVAIDNNKYFNENHNPLSSKGE